MDLEALLGIDPADPRDRLADYIVTADENLMSELVARRKELGLRQEDVAERMGIDKSNVSRIERGDRDLLQSTLRRYLMAIDSVVVHEVRAFEDIDCADKAARDPADIAAVREVLDSLPEKARRLALALMTNPDIAKAAIAANIPYASAMRYMSQIREAFTQAGFAPSTNKPQHK